VIGQEATWTKRHIGRGAARHSGRIVDRSYKARMPLLSMAVREALEEYAVARPQSSPIAVFQKW
jgi:hypothetical protein